MCFQRSQRNHTLYFTSSTLHNLLVENPITQQVGERVAKARSQLKMTQAELASEMTARLGREIRPLTVTRMEGGKRPIGVDELVVVAQALGIKPEHLLTDNLNIRSMIILEKWQALLRASNHLETAVREYISARRNMIGELEKGGGKYLDLLPAVTRAFVDRAVRDWTVEFIVEEAQREGEDDAAET